MAHHCPGQDKNNAAWECLSKSRADKLVQQMCCNQAPCLLNVCKSQYHFYISKIIICLVGHHAGSSVFRTLWDTSVQYMLLANAGDKHHVADGRHCTQTTIMVPGACNSTAGCTGNGTGFNPPPAPPPRPSLYPHWNLFSAKFYLECPTGEALMTTALRVYSSGQATDPRVKFTASPYPRQSVGQPPSWWRRRWLTATLSDRHLGLPTAWCRWECSLPTHSATQWDQFSFKIQPDSDGDTHA